MCRDIFVHCTDSSAERKYKIQIYNWNRPMRMERMGYFVYSSYHLHYYLYNGGQSYHIRHKTAKSGASKKVLSLSNA